MQGWGRKLRYLQRSCKDLGKQILLTLQGINCCVSYTCFWLHWRRKSHVVFWLKRDDACLWLEKKDCRVFREKMWELLRTHSKRWFPPRCKTKWQLSLNINVAVHREESNMLEICISPFQWKIQMSSHLPINVEPNCDLLIWRDSAGPHCFLETHTLSLWSLKVLWGWMVHALSLPGPFAKKQLQLT